jgi:prepilin-type N-terminal cleavage/methylation domain-containing protein
MTMPFTQQHARFHEKPAAFTLVELLVVIAIIGILVAMMLRRSRERALPLGG